MTALQIKTIAQRLQLSQRRLARACAGLMGVASLNVLINTGVWPARVDRAAVEQRLQQAIAAAGATPLEVATAFRSAGSAAAQKTKRPGPQATAAAQSPQSTPINQEIDDMLLAKQTLSQAARKTFGLFGNPFDGEVTSSAEMFTNADFRYCREACWQAASHGRFVAIVGESGAGKSTLLGDLRERIDADRKQIVVITPSVLGMEDNDKAGKTLKASGIMDAIIYTLAPLDTPKRTMEAKTRQLQRLLEESAKSGNSHLVLIEEAHALPINTLKHLKRLHELRMGRRPLLGILLLGQPELRAKLDEKRHDVREVVQRCEVVDLAPLDADLGAYLEHRLKRDEKRLADIFDAGAVDAIRARLTVQDPGRGDRRTQVVSLVYPLAVNNFVTAALNVAAELGVPRVTPDVVKAV